MSIPQFTTSKQFALQADAQDELAVYREQFHFPKHKGKDAIYLCGNSLGLQPIEAKSILEEELNDWAKFGVEGHFDAKRPWFKYHHFFTDSLAAIVGATSNEVVAMNTLTVNLHLLMLSFYKPTKKRYKIIMEAGAFPSDMYAMETQVQLHGFNPNDAIVEIAPRPGEHTLRMEDIEKTIHQHRNTVAVILFGGVNYYTGQYFDLQKITELGHKAGALVGFDLAHAVGNKQLQLHDWKVDFACWCSYKYLNSGPGAVGGLYVHERHTKNPSTFRLAGWWGYDEKSRFKMKKGFKPMKSAESWQMSNAQVFNMAAHRASLNIFDKVGMENLVAKSEALTAYTDYLLRQLDNLKFTIITPSTPKDRGCQLSLLFKSKGKEVFQALQKNGIIADWREPNVIRIAPVPLYTRFIDIYKMFTIMKSIS